MVSPSFAVLNTTFPDGSWAASAAHRSSAVRAAAAGAVDPDAVTGRSGRGDS
ncbi:hypothetical protein [Streptomyces sp. Agncl-13]|uniref:hypothetical protein n=1 Tax=Streptomyces sp. Agncl-13 TaxID=3400628 RepID=UPI003A87D276